MKKLLCLVRNMGDLQAIGRFLDTQNSKLMRRNIPIAINYSHDPKLTTFTVNWGGYGSSTKIDNGAQHYFRLPSHKDTSTRKEPLKDLVILLNGNFSEAEQKRFQDLGARLVPQVNTQVNLMIIGAKEKKNITKKARQAGHILISNRQSFMELLPKERTASKKRISLPKALSSLKKDFVKALHSRDLGVLEGFLVEFAPKLNQESITTLLSCIQIDRGELIFEGPWKPKTKMDKCYVQYALFSLLHKHRKNSKVISFCKQIDSLELMGHTHLELKFLGVATKLRTLELTCYGDIQTSSGWSALPTSLEKLQIWNTRLDDIDWKPKRYKKLESLRLINSPFSQFSTLSSFPNLQELKLHLTQGYSSTVIKVKSTQRFGAKLESLETKGIEFKGLDYEAMPALKLLCIHGDLTENIRITKASHLVQMELRIKTAISIDLQNQDSLKKVTIHQVSYPPKPSQQNINLHFQHCPQLESISLTASLHLEKLLANHLPKLSYFHIVLTNKNKQSGKILLGDLPSLTKTNITAHNTVLQLQSAPKLSFIMMRGVAIFDPQSSLPTLPSLETLQIYNEPSSQLKLPALPALKVFNLSATNITHLKKLHLPALTKFTLQAHELNTLTGMSLPSLQQLTIEASKLSTLSGLDGKTLSQLTLTTPSFTELHPLLDFDKLEKLVVNHTSSILPRLPKKNMDSTAITAYKNKIKRSLKRHKSPSKKSKTKAAKKSKSTRQWIAYFRKIIKNKQKDLLPSLEKELCNLPVDFWDKVMKGAKPTQHITYKRSIYSWNLKTKKPYPSSFNLENWEPVATVLNWANFRIAYELYLRLLSKSPAQHKLLTSCREELRVVILHLPNLFSLDAFPNIHQVRSNRVSSTNLPIRLSKLGALKQIKSLFLEKVHIEDKDWYISSSLESLHIQNLQDSSLSFMEKADNLQMLTLHGFFTSLKGICGKSLQIVSIGTNQSIAGEDLLFLEDSSDLHSLKLMLSKSKTPIPNLALSPSLSELSLTGDVFRSLEMIKQPQNILKLSLDKCDIHSLAGLSRYQKLQSLSIQLPLAELSSLPSLPDLKSMDTNLAPNAVLHLKNSLPKLENLSVHRHPLDSIDGIEFCPALKQINLYLSGEVKLAPFALLPLLENVSLRFKDAVEQDLTPLASSVFCKQINIIGVAQVKSLQFLAAFQKLENFSCNAKSIEDVHVLAEISSLKRVSLFGKNITKLKRLSPGFTVSKAW